MSNTDIDLNTIEGLENIDFNTTASEGDGQITDEERMEDVENVPRRHNRSARFLESETETLR